MALDNRDIRRLTAKTENPKEPVKVYTVGKTFVIKGIEVETSRIEKGITIHSDGGFEVAYACFDIYIFAHNHELLWKTEMLDSVIEIEFGVPDSILVDTKE